MSSRNVVLAAAAAVAGGLVADSVGAATITSHANDFEASYQTNGGNPDTYNSREGGTGGDELRVGGQSGIKFTGVYYFQLPALPAGHQITSANFATSSVADDSSASAAPVHNADLWGLGIDNNNFPGPITHNVPDATTSNAAAQAYYNDIDTLGGNDGAAPNANVVRLNSKIMDNFLAPSDFVAFGGSAVTKESDAAADAALVTHLNLLYADPKFVAGGSYAVFRVNPDAQPNTSSTRRYNISSATTADAGSILPTLTFDTAVVPEPGTAALAGLAGLAALLKRRR